MEHIHAHLGWRVGRGGCKIPTEILISWQGHASLSITLGSQKKAHVQTAPEKLAAYWAAVQINGEVKA